MRNIPRKSEEKTIKDDELYQRVAPRYIRLIGELSKKYKVTKDEYFSGLVNFKQNKEVPVQLQPEVDTIGSF